MISKGIHCPQRVVTLRRHTHWPDSPCSLPYQGIVTISTGEIKSGRSVRKCGFRLSVWERGYEHKARASVLPCDVMHSDERPLLARRAGISFPMPASGRAATGRERRRSFAVSTLRGARRADVLERFPTAVPAFELDPDLGQKEGVMRSRSKFAEFFISYNVDTYGNFFDQFRRFHQQGALYCI